MSVHRWSKALSAGDRRSLPNQSRVAKQEQLPATHDILEVAPGVLQMQLPIEFTGLGHVNMYGLPDRRGLAVVDPGMPGRRSWRDVVAALRRAGYRTRDVHTIVITHSHPDHFGGAQRLALEAGAAIVAHADFSVPWLLPGTPDVSSVEDAVGEAGQGSGGIRTPWRAAGDVLRPPPLRHSLPSPASRVAWRLALRDGGAPTPTESLTGGATIRLGDRDWFAVHTPGHTADHLCLHDPEHRVLLAGDHVLPTITPHVSGIGGGVDPLGQYLRSLDAVAGLDVNTVLPAHGRPFEGLAERSGEIAAHHERRLVRLRQIAEAIGPATVEAFSCEMFRAEQRGLMAESEVFAHLEHLRLRGPVRSWRRDGELVYQLDLDTTAPERETPASDMRCR